MAKVYFVREEISIEIPVGTSVLEAEIQAGLAPDVPCGGQGTCGKCLVKVDGKPVLACQTKVEKDCQVEIPGKKNRGKILSEGFSRKVNFQPELQVKTVWLEKPETGEKKSEWERLVEAVYENPETEKASHTIQRNIKTDIEIAGSLYKKRISEAEWDVIYIDDEILDLQPCFASQDASKERQEDNYKGVHPLLFTASIDLGTTTIVGYLLDGRTGETLAVESRMNPQMQYGGDVIQRANYALEHGEDVLSACVRKVINEILESLSVKARKALPIDIENRKNEVTNEKKEANEQAVNGKLGSAEWMPGVEDIYQVSLVGNTCMHHLFLGISPASLVHAPYTPAISQSLTLRAADYGIHIHQKGQLLLLPNIAGYIGADTSGCLLALRQDLKDEITLMLDIGTNTEMILGNKYGLAACSAASGPAFEGAKIQCGMRGLPGAIDHVKYEDGKWQYTTIGGEKPVGLCGSGLIDLVAELLRTGLLDENGILHSGQERSDWFMLVPPQETGFAQCEQNMSEDAQSEKTECLQRNEKNGSGQSRFENDCGVYLTQKDIGEVQLAKAAIAAGIQLLLKKRSIEESQIQTVYLAGGFGNYMSAENAARIGLIPESFVKKVQCVGNIAGEGAKIALLNKNERHEIENAVRNMEFLELAACPEFQDCFVDELGFER